MIGSASAVTEVRVESTAALIDDLLTRFDDEEVVWFRGHARADWKLRPSLARCGGLAAEQSLVDEFRRDATPLVERADLRGGDISEWDWLFLMQHYRVPTRLLDWSESPLAGVFFALDDSDVTDPPADGCVWALQPQKLNEDARLVAKQPWALPFCGSTSEANWYLPRELDTGGRSLAPIAITAARRFDRIRAQTGTFTIIHKDDSPLEESSPNVLTRYLIPEGMKDHLRRELVRLGVHAAIMYPDLEHVGRRVAGRVQ